LTCRPHIACFYRQEQKIRAYRKLVYHLPSIKKIVDEFGADELQVFFKSVRSSCLIVCGVTESDGC
jgi:hypothetical protein